MYRPERYLVDYWWIIGIVNIGGLLDWVSDN